MTTPQITVIGIARPLDPQDEPDARFKAGFWEGRRQLKLELVPLIEAVNDAMLMFKDIKKARELPPYGQVQNQYIALGKRLEELLAITDLDPTE